jgi:Uma2 family endonuclease
MANQSARRLTWDDLLRMPEESKFREIIDGELFVSPTPLVRHQRVVLAIAIACHDWTRDNGGDALIAPLDVVLDRFNVVEPDVLVIREERLHVIQDGYPRAAPDLAVEVSSPSTKGRDRIKKRALYERFGVAEYWIVDLDEDVIEAYVLSDGRYDEPRRFAAGDTVEASVLPGFSAPFDRLVPPA